MDGIDESNETAAGPVQRERRWWAAAVLLVLAAAFAVLAVQVHFLFVMGVPPLVGLTYGAWLGLTTHELLNATSQSMPSDATGMNTF